MPFFKSHYNYYLLALLILILSSSCNKDEIHPSGHYIKLNSICDLELHLDVMPSGTISTIIHGGTEPYTYEWSTGESTKEITYDTALDISLTVRDADNCSVTHACSTSEPDYCADFSVSIVEYPKGTFTAEAEYGRAPFTYTWDNGGTGSSVTDYSVSEIGVSVEDALGCRAKDDNVALGSIDCYQFSAYIHEDAPGILTVYASGALEPYHYFWNTGDNTKTIDIESGGRYTVIITDSSDCLTMASIQF